MKLTARQEQVLNVIRQYVADTGYPPTRADIARELGFKSPTPPRNTFAHWPEKALLR